MINMCTVYSMYYSKVDEHSWSTKHYLQLKTVLPHARSVKNSDTFNCYLALSLSASLFSWELASPNFCVDMKHTGNPDVTCFA
jgi:hypothetical protein